MPSGRFRRQRRGRRPTADAVAPVVAILLMVAITVVLTAVLYAFVTNLAQTVREPPPYVAFTNVGVRGDVWDFRVISDRVRPLQEFSMRIEAEGMVDAASNFGKLLPGTHGNATFTDFDGGGKLSSGDIVSVRSTPGWSYNLFVFWQGELVGRTHWNA